MLDLIKSLFKRRPMTLQEWQDKNNGADPTKRVKVRIPGVGEGWLVSVKHHGTGQWVAWIGGPSYNILRGGPVTPVPIKNYNDLLSWEVLSD